MCGCIVRFISYRARPVSGPNTVRYRKIAENLALLIALIAMSRSFCLVLNPRLISGVLFER